MILFKGKCQSGMYQVHLTLRGFYDRKMKGTKKTAIYGRFFVIQLVGIDFNTQAVMPPELNVVV